MAKHKVGRMWRRAKRAGEARTEGGTGGSEASEGRALRALEAISSRIKIKQGVARTRAFYKWRETAKEFSFTEIQGNSEMDVTTHQ